MTPYTLKLKNLTSFVPHLLQNNVHRTQKTNVPLLLGSIKPLQLPNITPKLQRQAYRKVAEQKKERLFEQTFGK